MGNTRDNKSDLPRYGGNCLMSVQAKWSGSCKRCGKSYTAGETIHSTVKGVWCTDAMCAAVAQTVAPAQQAQQTQQQAAPQTLEQALKPVQPAAQQGLSMAQIQTIVIKTELLYSINSKIMEILKRHTADPNPAMVGQFTKIIYDDLTS